MTRSTAQDPAAPTANELRRHQAAVADIGKVGLFRRGTLLQRSTRCGNPNCRCSADPPHLHGPYWQWTRKVAGRTVTVYLSDQQAALVSTWLENGRRLDAALARFEELSTAVTDRILSAHSRR